MSRQSSFIDATKEAKYSESGSASFLRGRIASPRSSKDNGGGYGTDSPIPNNPSYGGSGPRPYHDAGFYGEETPSAADLYRDSYRDGPPIRIERTQAASLRGQGDQSGYGGRMGSQLGTVAFSTVLQARRNPGPAARASARSAIFHSRAIYSKYICGCAVI